ncbi:hypothetical protein J7L06_07650, partial [Candidatus Bathyarchaeota archaeon]|nr:hypothetical protein [Candidatus Bathyarchaeota archaeon]
HLNILSDVLRVEGIERDPDVALFPNVDVSTEVMGIQQKLPVIRGACCSFSPEFTNFGRNRNRVDNW